MHNYQSRNETLFLRYILVYPQGCDVANHLSLFLCVADYDKLLPGWSHFAQFTIAVVNKDPKKSKYSDTLHRFCKKEHDWGWKKFMELGKVGAAAKRSAVQASGIAKEKKWRRFIWGRKEGEQTTQRGARRARAVCGPTTTPGPKQ